MNGSSMKSQIFVAIGVAIVASVLVTGLASSIYAQSNMTGGNMSMPTAGTSGDDGGDGGGDDGGSDGDGGGDDNDGGENEEGGGNN
jgi:hypothetical protein